MQNRLQDDYRRRRQATTTTEPTKHVKHQPLTEERHPSHQASTSTAGDFFFNINPVLTPYYWKGYYICVNAFASLRARVVSLASGEGLYPTVSKG
jgi:hypothetical protein